MTCLGCAPCLRNSNFRVRVYTAVINARKPPPPAFDILPSYLVPFRWTIARPGGRFTIQVDQIQQNVPIDNGKFAKPPEPPAPALKFTSP